MKIRRHLSYANVTATIALVAALATGGAYAQSRITTGEIQNRAVTAPKIAMNAVRGGVHVRQNSITGRQVREWTLNARGFSRVGGSEEPPCDPLEGSFIDCATVTLRLPAPGRVLVVATGANYSVGGPANGRCEVRANHQDQARAQVLGETSTVNTSALAAAGFARTLVTPTLPRGPVELTLACEQAGSADFRIDAPTIAAIALTHGRP